jgi:hypothetical protein
MNKKGSGGDTPKTRKEKKGRKGREEKRSPMYSSKHVRAAEKRQGGGITNIIEHTQTTAP